MGKGDPDPEVGAAGPETLLNKGFREGLFCATNQLSTLFAFGDQKSQKLQKVEI